MNRDYLFTDVYQSASDFNLEEGSVYLYAISPEERSVFPRFLKETNPLVQFIELEEIDEETIRNVETGQEFFLKSPKSILSLFASKNYKRIYIDVTGISNRVCAPLIKYSILHFQEKQVENVSVVYAEPATYLIKKFKAESVFNNLSEQIEGISPLPGFATIFDNIDESVLIAFLGFEGSRFSHILENVQIASKDVIPVVGVPGFRIEYPFVAFWGNRRTLEESQVWRQIKFVPANSLVEPYRLLKKIMQTNKLTKIRIAPIGTKPHAIATMLFATVYPDVEIIYDNPKRKIKRTNGLGKIIHCKISKLVET